MSSASTIETAPRALDDAQPCPIPATEFAELALGSTHSSASIGAPVRMDALSSEQIGRQWVSISSTIAVVSFLLLHICDMNFCDPDMWHEMSLFREALVEGRVPTEDRFAYTPTVSPSIHHEWGSGAIFYGVWTSVGGPGIMALKYALVITVVSLCYWCARSRGASTAVFKTVVPAITLFSSYGFTTIRAQVFTLALLALMLCLLELDRRGNRWWILFWLPLHVFWLNVHAGFVVGSGLMALHAIEQIVRRQPFWHFVPIGMALASLILVNPYGTDYVPYLMHGLTMARPLIVEWNPLWQHDSKVFTLFLLSLIPIGYSIRQLGLQRMVGLVLLAASAYAALKHTRHLSIYCVVWTCYVPGYLQQTKFGSMIDRFFEQYGRTVAQTSILVTLLCLCRIIPTEPWRLNFPSSNEDSDLGLVCYPVGAVKHLKETGFHGNVMLPFEVGGYAMWNLFPQAKVSIDGRYEVAYQPGILEEHLRLFAAKDGWQAILDKYPTDTVLVPTRSKLAKQMPEQSSWFKQFDDGVYQVYSRAAASVADQVE